MRTGAGQRKTGAAVARSLVMALFFLPAFSGANLVNPPPNQGLEKNSKIEQTN
jgi:hypothetical protein